MDREGRYNLLRVNQKTFVWKVSLDTSETNDWKPRWTCGRNWFAHLKTASHSHASLAPWQITASHFLPIIVCFWRKKEYFAEKKHIFSSHGHLSSVLISVKIIVIDYLQDSCDGEFGGISTDTNMARVKETSTNKTAHAVLTASYTECSCMHLLPINFFPVPRIILLKKLQQPIALPNCLYCL